VVAAAKGRRSVTEPLATVRVARVPVHILDVRATLAQIDAFIAAGTPHYNIAINAAKVVEYQEDEQLRRAICDAHLLTADGQAIVWAARLLGTSLPERVAGADLMELLLEHSARHNYSVYLLGAKQAVVEACVRRAKELYPDLAIAGYRNGYFTKDEEPAVVDAIRAVKPQILFLGFGTPAKEYFMHRNYQDLGVPFVMGVGGTFDVFAGLVRRAPKWMQQAGLEWFYRFAQEPRRMWRRYLYGNTRFAALVARNFVDKRFGQQ
jgi:N-acetylglucosaminyldiphosphoundecaprenol N-acetyl-beta-D-mannosaminyltransferase